MDLQKLVDAMGEQGRLTRGKYQLTLGGLIARLSEADPELPVRFDNGSNPGEFDSYRGYYSDLMIQPGAICTVADLLARAKAAVGETFEGYKGGDFRMGNDTPLWCSTYGCTGPAIMDAVDSGGEVVLVTKEIE